MMTHSRLDIQELIAMCGRPVYGANGEKLGNLEEIYVDEATQQPEWIAVEESTLGGLLGTKHFLLPIMEAQLLVEGGEQPAIRVPYSKDQVKDAPQVDGDYIPEEQEREVYAYYGLQASERRSETQFPATESTPERPSGEIDVSRHEEEMRVGKREIDAGRVRLRKWVETEPVSEDVQLHRETARVERHEVDRPAPGAEIGEEETEMRLHREEPVVSKETVERERITAEREEEVDQETVRDEVRRERVEVEEDDSHDSHGGHRHDSHEGSR
jgi:stress response protein YsnF